jgi:hypothetical protein
MSNDNLTQLTESVNQALIQAFGTGAPGPGDNFEWLAMLESVRLVKIGVDSGLGDIEKLAQSAHQGWCTVVQSDLSNQLQLDTPTTAERKSKRHLLTQIPYDHFPDAEKERYRLIARTVLNH